MATTTEIPLIQNYIVPQKQGAKRHYGVHPYFTRRPWNVVQAYIQNYCPFKNGVVLDPFGGSGVTAIEAAVLGMTGCQVDINPFATFIAHEVGRVGVAPEKVFNSAQTILMKAKQILSRTKTNTILSKYWYPKNIALPTNADVETVEELFTDVQLAQLAVLRELIEEEKNVGIRQQLLLIFSGTLAKTNRTFVSAKGRKESRGGATILSLFRYHVPAHPVELLPLDQFQSRLAKYVAAKNELIQLVSASGGKMDIKNGSATRLSNFQNQSVDYIFTDPPYGSYIQYIDLSSMWNAWLQLSISDSSRKNEVIAQGKNNSSYYELLSKSAEECFRVLKQNRYLSLVFSHRDLSVWKEVLEIFERAGFTYQTSVAQPLKTVWSVHKKKSDLSAIAGELIITFSKGINRKKTASNPRVRTITDAIDRAIRHIDTLTTDDLCLKLVPILIENDLLTKFSSSKNIMELLTERLNYSKKTKTWKRNAQLELGT